MHEATGDELDYQEEFIYDVYTKLLEDVRQQASRSKIELYEEQVNKQL